MSNSIWKTPDQKPDSRKQILIYDGVDYSIEISHPEYWEDKGLVEKWCYWDEFIAQADKAERLQKAVDLALGWLEKVATPAKCDDALCREFTKRKIDEIKQTIEG